MDFPLIELKTSDILAFFLRNPYIRGFFASEIVLPAKGNVLLRQVSEREDFMYR